MTRLFNRWLPCATLATWGAVLLFFFFSRRIDALLHPMFRVYVLAAGFVLLLMAAIFLFFPADASCCSSAECGTWLAGPNAGKLLTFFILLFPISMAAFFSPASFGKTMLENRRILTDGSSLPARSPGNAASAGSAPAIKERSAPSPIVSASANETATPDYLQRTPEGHIVAEVLDLLYAAQDAVLRKDFEGKTVQLIGQLMPDKTSGESAAKRFKAVRMFMTCCAADARPVATLIEVDTLPDLPEMTWIKITGTSTFPTEKGRRISVLKADRVEKADPPEELMLY
jgi:uncharacterized repeat protein (TIGR03943 family)